MIRRLTSVTDADIAGLVDVLVDCVAGGASVGFMHPLVLSTAQGFWRDVAERVGRGERALLVAEDQAGIVGTVHLVLDQPQNQPHRADVTKMLVHRRARRQGVGPALISAVEVLARELGRSLLVLDTITGSDAERLYTELGWHRVGVIPDYALMPQGGLAPTTVFYRQLNAVEPG